MATTRTRRSTRAPKSRAVSSRKKDFIDIIRGYQGQGVKLLKRPSTRYVLGGVALTALVPFALRMFRNEEVQTFVRDNVEDIRTRIEGVIHSGERDLDSLS